VYPSLRLKKETDPVSETLFSAYSDFRTVEEVYKEIDSKDDILCKVLSFTANEYTCMSNIQPCQSRVRNQCLE
jgi:hypothetical protein